MRSKILKLTKSRMVVAMGWGELLFNGFRISVLQDEKVLGDLLYNMNIVNTIEL